MQRLEEDCKGQGINDALRSCSQRLVIRCILGMEHARYVPDSAEASVNDAGPTPAAHIIQECVNFPDMSGRG